MEKICDKNECTGCFACYNVCPKNAITMEEGKLGHIYPKIDDKKCINCKLCQRICPNNKKVEIKEPIKAYAMKSKNDSIRDKSTSGGAATIFALNVLKKNGVVYGANNIENGRFNFIRINKVEELEKIKGSKYVQCYINDIFKKIKEDLDNKLEVLFVGTPCQVSGLKAFLGKEYENLIIVDLICHGVPSQRLLMEEIEETVEDASKINKILFRTQEKSGFNLTLYEDGKLKLSKEMTESCYYKGFMNALFYRDSCYKCKYAQPRRISDITIGDFWGLSEESKLYKDRKKGVSLLLPITEKGINFIEECKNYMELEERDIAEAIKGNSQLRHPSIKPKKYNKFVKIYEKKGLKKAYLKTRTLKQKMRDNKVIMNIYKRIKEK